MTGTGRGVALLMVDGDIHSLLNASVLLNEQGLPMETAVTLTQPALPELPLMEGKPRNRKERRAAKRRPT